MSKRAKRNKSPPYRRQKYLCTAGEWRFCRKLEEAVGDRFTIMMQVRVGALLVVPAEDWERWGLRVSQKSFDFALVTKGSSHVAAVVELDDKTHLLPARRKRDKFLDEACKRADLPLIRFKTAQRYDVNVIRETVKVAWEAIVGFRGGNNSNPLQPRWPTTKLTLTRSPSSWNC